ncbi:MAG: folate family ECF transporter S component [Lachnospiraceae bacterium]|nr:folate family ECF transporter S component [Lachnospiraceae bacterium]
MQKNTYKTKWDTHTLVFMGLLVAMNLVLTRVVAFDLGFVRITVGSVCTIMAGLWLGPVAGGVCGFASDILGCILKGYAINPLITIAAILWGVIPALMRPLATGKKSRKITWLSVSVIITYLLSSTFFTTLGLVLFNGYQLLAIIPGRMMQLAVMAPLYCVLTCCLYMSPITGMVMNASAKRQEKKAARTA